MRREIVLGAVVGAVLGLASGGAAAQDAAVEVRLFQFRPGAVDVARGARVTWTNRDEIGHTVTAGTPEAPTGRFDLKLDDKGATASVELAPGAYPYFCRRHNAMRGEVRVK
jgi:plastocyanin